MSTDTNAAVLTATTKMNHQFADRCGHMHAALTDIAIHAKVSQQLETVESLRAALADLATKARGAELEDNRDRDKMFAV